MTLEELLAAMTKAVEASKAKPDDAALKKAAADATKAYDDEKAKQEKESGDPDPDDEDPKWDDKTKAYIKKLRKENQGQRQRNKELISEKQELTERQKAILKAAGIEDESEKPEEKIKNLSASNGQLAFRNAVLETAVANGISGDDVEYFEFLVSKEVNALGEDEELSEERLLEIAGKVKKAGKGGANTGVKDKDGKGTGGDPKPGESGDVSLDDFCRMGIVEKSKLYEKNPELYKKLFAEAREKKRI